MWKILQHDTPEDWVIATGVTTSVRDFVRMSFKEIGIKLDFRGEGEHEVGIVVESNNPNFEVPLGQEVIAVDPRYYRPTEVELLIGDSTKAKTKLDWEPKYDVEALCSEMVKADVGLFRQDQLLKEAGFDVRNEYE